MVPTFTLEPFDGVGAQLCPCSIATGTPQTFPVASSSGEIDQPRSSPHEPIVRMRAATQPRSARLELVESLERRSVAGSCSYTVPSRLPDPGPIDGGITDGAYAVTLTNEDALRTGFPHECLVAGNESTVTVTLVIDGTGWTEIQACSDGEPPFVGSHGTLRYEGDRVILTEPDFPGHMAYGWRHDGNVLSLRLLEVEPDHVETEVLRFLFENNFTKAAGE